MRGFGDDLGVRTIVGSFVVVDDEAAFVGFALSATVRVTRRRMGFCICG
jgi:hypothetical protein